MLGRKNKEKILINFSKQHIAKFLLYHVKKTNYTNKKKRKVKIHQNKAEYNHDFEILSRQHNKHYLIWKFGLNLFFFMGPH